MIPPAGDWHRFRDTAEKVSYLKRYNLMKKREKEVPVIKYTGLYTDKAVPCDVVGYVNENSAVILVKGELHCIDPNYLKQLQSGSIGNNTDEDELELEEKRRCEITYTKKFKIPPVSFVSFDLETTNRNSSECAIIEIGAVKYINGVRNEEFQCFIEPEAQISIFARNVNQISDEMLVDAIPAAEGLKEFKAFCGSLPLIAFNGASFDFKVLERQCEKHKIRYKAEGYDSMQAARRELPGHERYTLASLKADFDLPGGSHRAIDDAIVSAEIWLRCFPDFYIEGLRPGSEYVTGDIADDTKQYYDDILAALSNSMENYDLSMVTCGHVITESTEYDRIQILGTTAFQIKGAGKRYLYFPTRYAEHFTHEGVHFEDKRFGSWFRILVSDFSTFAGHDYIPIEAYETELLSSDCFGCCGSYVACSDELHCLQKDIMFAGRCQYRQNLRHGRIFYGKNKNAGQ